MRATIGSSLPRRSRLGCSCATAVLILLTTARAFPQTSPAVPSSEPASEARRHFDRGVTFYDEGDYSAALVEFKRAYAIAPTWQVLFNIGQSYFQIRDYAQALVTLGRFVEEGQERIPEDRRALVDSERADLHNRVGHARIQCNASGATVSVDDVVVGVTPLNDPLLVSVGVRKLSVVRSGNAPIERQVSVPAGDTVDVRFDFPDTSRREAPALVPAERIPTSVERGVSSRSGVPAFSAIGVASAGAVVGTVFGLLAIRDKSRLQSECAGKACVFGSQADIDAISRDGTVSTVAFGVAAAGAVASLVLWLTVGGHARTAPTGWGVPGPTTAAASIRWTPGFVAGQF